MTTGGDYQIFEAGDVALQSGVVFPSLRLAYQDLRHAERGARIM